MGKTNRLLQATCMLDSIFFCYASPLSFYGCLPYQMLTLTLLYELYPLPTYCNNSRVITLSSFLKWELITPDTIHRTNLYIGVRRARVKLYLQLFSDATNLHCLHKKQYIYICICVVSSKEKRNKHPAVLRTRQENKHPMALRNENELKMSRYHPDILPNQIASAIFEWHEERTTCVMSPGPNSWGLSHQVAPYNPEFQLLVEAVCGSVE